MRKLLLPIAFVFLFVLSFRAQTDNSAPVVWQRYKIGGKKLSILLPKMPIKLARSSKCGDVLTVTYYAYAEGAAYELVVTSESSPPFQYPDCPKRSSFGPATLAARLDEINSRADKPIAEKAVSAGLQGYKFTGKNSVRWVLSDIPENDRWIELAVTHYPEEKPDFERYIGSLQFSDRAGTEIGDGSKVTLGDLSTGNVTGPVSVTPPPGGPPDTGAGSGTGDGKTAQDSNGNPIVTSPFIVVAQPKATYTDAARAADTKGAVRLKVTLLPNGAVGPVTPVTELKHGLTEQAIYAARRTVFLPKRVNGVAVAVVRTVEYTFTIY